MGVKRDAKFGKIVNTLPDSLRSKLFQSSYYAKVRAGAKKKKKRFSNRVIARKLEREQKKKVEGGGGGEKRKRLPANPTILENAP